MYLRNVNRTSMYLRNVNRTRMYNRNVNRKTGIISALFILTDQLITTSQNKRKEGGIKSAEQRKQIWINSVLKVHMLN